MKKKIIQLIFLCFAAIAAPGFAAPKAPGSAPFSNVTSSQIQANWKAKGNNLSTTYTAIISNLPSPSTNGASDNKSITTSELFAVFTSLSPNTRFYVDVRATDRTGNSKYTHLGSVPTLANVPTSAAPTAIQSNQITAHWGASGNPAGTTYIAQISLDDGFSTIAQAISTTSLSATFTGLSASTPYFMRVQAVNLNLVGTSFVTLPPATTLGNPPAAPGVSGFSNITTTELQANWTSNGNPAGTIYTAVLSTAPSPGTNNAAGNQTIITTDLSAVFVNLAVNKLYFVSVRASNAAGNSAFTTLGSIATLANVPLSGDPTNIQASQITAHWTANGNPAGTSYLAQASSDAGFSSIVTAIPTTSLSATFTGLSAATTYFMRVQAVNQNAVGTTFRTLPSAVTLEPQPGSPGAAGFTNIAMTQIQANWTANGNPAGTTYTAILSALPSPSTNGSAGNQTITTTNLFAVFTGLAINERFFVEVRVGGAGENNPYTDLGSIATLANVPAAAAPTDIQASEITANWGANGNPANTSYLAQISADSAFASIVAAIPTTALSATFTGLSAGTLYYMRAQAMNQDDVRTAFTTLPPAATEGNPPAVPGSAGFSTILATQLQANWTPNGNPIGTNYTVVLSTAPSPGTNGAAGNLINTSTDFFAVFSNLAVNQFYYAEVKAFNGGGTSAWTSLGSVPTLANIPSAGSPTNIQADEITANWIANGNPAGTLYLVQLSLEPDLNPLIDAHATDLTFATFTGLSANTTYYMQVKAINQAAQQTAAVALPPAQTTIESPEGPALSASQITDSSILWTWNSVPNAAGYRLISDNGGAPSADLPPSAIEWLDSGLPVNTAHSRRLVAFNASGNSTSTVVTAYTLAHQPTDVSVSSVSSSSATFQWTANGNPIFTQYLVQCVDNFNDVSSMTVVGQQAILDSLLGDTTYFCTVRAVNGAGTAASADTILTITTVPQLVAFHQICPSDSNTLAFNGPKGQVRVELPVGAFSGCVQITATIPGSFPDSPSSGTPLVGTRVGLRLENDLHLQPLTPITLRVPFSASDVPAEKRSRLVIARYDETHNAWVMLQSSIDPDQNFVTAKTDHLSLFQIMVAVPGTDLSAIRVYPNPFRPAIGHTSITFVNLPTDASIQIFTLSGEKVQDLNATPAGTASWDGRNKSGQPAASGVYFAVVKSGSEKKLLKVAVQR